MEDIAEDIADVAEAKVDVDTVGRWSVLLNVLGISGRVEEEDAQDAAEEVDMLCACPFFEDERCRVVELGISKLLKRSLFEFIVGVTLKRHRFAHRVVQHEHIHVKPSWIVSHSTIKRYELKVIREVASDAPSFRPIPDEFEPNTFNFRSVPFLPMHSHTKIEKRECRTHQHPRQLFIFQ